MLLMSMATHAALWTSGCGPMGPVSMEPGPQQEKVPEKVSARVELPGLGVQDITYEKIDGRAVFEGDILLDVRPDASHGSQSIGQRYKNYLWPDRRVPYVIDPNLPNSGRVMDAISHWEALTSLRFHPRTPQDTNYVKFVPSAPGTNCSSYVGKQGFEQEVRLEEACSTGAVIHEIGHAVGLWHEQSRSDRDHYVTIHLENVLSGQEHNFAKLSSGTLDIGPYDVNSIMHYGAYDFTSNGLPTIVRKDGGGTSGIGQRNGLSSGDVQGVEFLYGRPTEFRSGLNDGRCLDVTGGSSSSGTFTQLWDCNGTPAQKWYRTAQQELRSALAPHLCLDVSLGDATPGTRVQIWECNGTPAQKWTFLGAQVKSALGSNLCLDVFNGDPSLGTRVQIWECNLTYAQFWYQPNE
jgi:hypothetical protein